MTRRSPHSAPGPNWDNLGLFIGASLIVFGIVSNMAGVYYFTDPPVRD